MELVNEQKLIDDAFAFSEYKTEKEIDRVLESGAYTEKEKILLEKYLKMFQKYKNERERK